MDKISDLKQIIISTLDSNKALDIVSIDLKGFFLVIAQIILSILNCFFASIEILICPL